MKTLPSRFIQDMLEQYITKYDDPLQLCIAVERQLLQGLVDELQDDDLTFRDKFQLIADINYCGEYLENLIEALDNALHSEDPFFRLISYFSEDDLPPLYQNEEYLR